MKYGLNIRHGKWESVMWFTICRITWRMLKGVP